MIDFVEGVRLGTLERKHIPQLRAWRNDYGTWRSCRQNDLLNEVEHEAWFLKQANDPSISMYSIIQCGEIRGVCGFTSIDLLNRRAEFSLYIDHELKCDDVGFSALKTLISHGFSNLGLNHIFGESFDQDRTERLERAGFKKEGTRREYYFRSCQFVDAHLYSILRREWEKNDMYSKVQVST